MKKIDQKNKSRRNFFKLGLGLAGTAVTTHSLAQVCTSVTGAQGLGPFFPNPDTPVDAIKENPDPNIPLFLSNDNDLTFIRGRNGVATGQKVFVRGVLQDENCQPLNGATIIIWQASASGRYNHKGDDQNQDFLDPRDGTLIQRTLDPYFQSWGQTTTNEQGEYEFKTIVPGYYPADINNEWYRPPHIHFLVSATGFSQFVTQMYFRSPLIHDNQWIQELNQKDLLLQASSLTDQQRQNLIVDFTQEPTSQMLLGNFDMTIRR